MRSMLKITPAIGNHAIVYVAIVDYDVTPKTSSNIAKLIKYHETLVEHCEMLVKHHGMLVKHCETLVKHVKHHETLEAVDE